MPPESAGGRLFQSLRAHHFYVMSDALPPFRCRQMEEAESDVAFYGEPGKDSALLKDENAPRVGSVDGFPIDLDLSAGGCKKTGHGAEQG